MRSQQHQLVLAVLLGLVTAASAGVYVSRRQGRSRRLLGVAPAETLSGADFTRCQLACLQRGDCRSFNLSPQLGQCELFTVTACDHHSYYVQTEADWRWYDVVADLSAESSQPLWRQEACEDEGRCRDSCLRRLEQNCRHDQQCGHLVTGGTQCSENVCRCGAEHWQYNTTLCLPRGRQLSTEGYSWVWKKIVGGLCEAEFELKAGERARITVSEQYTLSANRYVFAMSTETVEARRIPSGGSNKQVQSKFASLLSAKMFHGYKISWCGGKLRLWRTDHTEPYISWDDRTPFSPAYLAMSTEVRGRWRFQEGLVDPWFDTDWAASRVYSLPPDTLLTRGRSEQDFWVEFDCRIAADRQWVAREEFKWEDKNIWKVILGGWVNTASAIHHHTNDLGWSSVVQVPTPGILSGTEFRRFRVHFSPAEISVFRADEQQPFMTHTVTDPFTINYDGPLMCCNEGNADFRLVKYDDGWSYEGGFIWGRP